MNASSADHAGAAGHTGWLPPVTPADVLEARGNHLVDVEALGPRGVVEVRTAEHGILAVGMTPQGVPFAVGDVCRHQFARLGRGRVTDDGCLECPWHRAHFDVANGSMRSGPKGKLFGIAPYSKAVRAVANQFTLSTYPVEVSDGAIRLTSEG